MILYGLTARVKEKILKRTDQNMYKIVRKKELNSSVTLMEIEAPFVAKKAKAGQFIIFRIDEMGERVPLTIAGYDREAGTVTIIFQKVGFSTITKSLTDDIIMPIIAIFMGGIDFSEMKIVLPRLFSDPVLDEAGNEILNTLNYGNFISAMINFLILALVVFFLVKGLNRLTEKKEPEPPAPPADPEPSAEEKLLTEIRDLLANK